MRALAVHVGVDPLEGVVGAVLAHDLRRPESKAVLFRKGHRFSREDVSRLAELRGATLHVLELEPGDLHEEEAGRRLARAVAGQGVAVKGYIGAQYHLVAAHRGLLRVDVGLLDRVNTLEGVSVFTLFDGQPVDEGQLVAGVKVTPLAIAEAIVRQAEEACREAPPLRVVAFRARVVGVLVLEQVDPSTRQRFQTALEQKLGWLGARLGPILEVERSPRAFAAAFRRLRDHGVDVVLAAGASSLDPLEPLFLSLQEVGARVEKHGAPVHPGSLFWVAYLPAPSQEVPVFGLSSCEMFSHKTVLDLVLPRVLAGETVRRADLVALGHGGLLTPEMAFRFPPYGERGARGAAPPRGDEEREGAASSG